MSSPQQPPQPPSFGQSYQQGLQVYQRYLPQMLRNEMMFRNLYDPQRIQEQQSLQGLYGPTQYSQQLQALQQLDPTGVALRQNLGNTISAMLAQGYVDPLQNQVYNTLGRSAVTQLLRGTQQDPVTLSQEAQQIRAGEAARGNITGNAPAMAEALYQGQRGQQLLQQRQAAAQGFMGLQSPRAGALAQAGSFLSSPTPEQQIAGISGVNPDRAFAYDNPNAGYLGVQGGLQQYGQQLAAYQAGGGATNPWMNALGGAASGAAGGAAFGPYGALAGGIGGGLAGYFSDARLKENITDTGRKSRDGIPIVRFRFKGIPATFEGVIGDDVKRLRPDAVTDIGGYQMVDYGKIGVEFKEIDHGLGNNKS